MNTSSAPQIRMGAVAAPSISDTMAHLYVYNSTTLQYVLNPLVTSGVNVTVTDIGNVDAVGMLAILTAINASASVQLVLPNALRISGTLGELTSLMAAANLDHVATPSLQTLGFSEQDIDAQAVVGLFHGGFRDFIFDGSGIISLNGTIARVLDAIDIMSGSLSGHEDINLTGVTMARLADVAAVQAHTSGTVSVVSLSDTIAHLGTYDEDNQNWSINPAVTAGADVTVTDSGAIPAVFLLDLLHATDWQGHVSVPNATTIVGTVNDINNLFYSDVTLPDGVEFTLSDTSLDAALVVDFFANHDGLVLNGAGVATLSGSLADINAVLQETDILLSGQQALHIRNISLADFNAERAALAAQTSGAITALLYDTADNLVSQNPTTHVWSAKAGVGAGFSIQIQYATEVTMAAGAVLALLARVGAGDGIYVNVTAVTEFTGSVADILQLRQTQVQTYYYAATLSDAEATAADLLTLVQRTVHGVNAESVDLVSGTLVELYELRQVNIDWSVNLDISVTSPLTVAELAAARSSFSSFTYGDVTGALADSVAHLTGHTAEAGANGYTVIDTVAHVLAGGAVVAGAHGIQLADSIANLTGHTTAGGATAYSVIDTVANLDNYAGVITSDALAVTARDTVAHLANGHTDAGGATSYIVADSLAHILDQDASALVGASAGVALTDTTLDAALIYDAWDQEWLNYEQQVDASSVLSVSGEGDVVLAVLSNPALHFSGTEQVTLSGQTEVSNANQIDAMTTGVVTASISGATQYLLGLTGTGNHYDLTVSDAASVAQLKALDAVTTGAISYGAVIDTASNLVKLVGGVWTVDSQLHANTDIIVIGDIGAGALQALQEFNIDGDVTVASKAANDFSIATGAVHDYTIAAGQVTNLIDVAGAQTYHVAQSSGLQSGGVLNLSGVDGHNTIVFDGYYAGSGALFLAPRSYLTMTQSGTTAYFLDADTHIQVAAISLNANAGVQYIEYANGNQMELKLVGTVDPVIQLYWND